MLKWSFVVGLSLYAIGMRHGVAAPGTEIRHLAFEQKSIVELGPTLAPLHHVRFCQRYPADCQPNANANELVELDNKTLGLLQRINHQVNTTIAPVRKDYDSNVEASWTIAPNGGDCNDYAVTKRHELLARGWPARSLLLAEVVVPSGEHHLVLVVRTREDDFVLDNLSWNVRPVSQIHYQWVRVQQASNPRFWSTVSVARATRVAMNTR
jgi:predicted transglutaminase-like cysteine proteinase